MNRYKKLSLSVFIVLSSTLLMGALLQKSEASLSVIKAGVDDKGNPECVNKSQVYLFKRIRQKIRLFSITIIRAILMLQL